MPDRLDASNYFSLNYSTTNLTSANPFATNVGYTQIQVPGPFVTTNPTNGSWRVLSAQLKVINTTNITARNGDCAYAYNPGLPSATITTSTLDWARSNLDQLEWNLPLSGDVAAIVNWVPNDEEIQISSAAPNSYSAIQGYILSTVAMAQTFRFEWDLGIEYIPSTLYRPFVDRKLPKTHPDATYYVNQELSANWDKWVILPYLEYLRSVKALDVVDPGFLPVQRLNAMGAVGTSGVVGDLDVADEVVYRGQDVIEDPYTGYDVMGAVGKVGNAIVDTACYVSPDLPFCQPRYETRRLMRTDMNVGPDDFRRAIGRY
jgi:hypothetical protein